jgi:hypothetical protein
MSLVTRVVREKRALLGPLALIGAANLAVLLLGIVPMRARVSTMEARAVRASADVVTAGQQLEQAQRTVAGKARASEQLTRFYDQVLPVDQSTARKVTHLDLARLARDANLRVSRRKQAQEEDEDSALVRLDTTMVLTGSYADVREFLYQVETAPEFVVINDVAMAQTERTEGSLVLTLELSTYFRANRDR